MKWVNALAAALLGLIGIGIVRDFLSKYEIVVFNKDQIDTQEGVQDNEETYLDLRGTPTHVCVCGSNHWNVRAVFDNYEIATYFLDMQCSVCGNLATAPTPLDREGLEN